MWTRAFRLLVSLYPRGFREAFGEDMIATFDREVALARSRRGGAFRTLRTGLAGVLGTPLGIGAEWLHVWRRARAEKVIGRSRGSRLRGGERVVASDQLARDVHLFARLVRRQPAFTLLTVVTLALGIGAGVAIFSVVRGVILRPLPYAEPEELVYLTGGGASSVPNILDLGARLSSMESVEGVFVPESKVLTGSGEPTQLRTTVVTSGFFALLGISPAVGRFIDDSDLETRRVVLSNDQWVSRFGADPGIVGRSIVLDGVGFEVIGVAPPVLGERFESDVWLPMPWAADIGPRQSRSWRSVEPYARLEEGVSREAATRELEAVWSGMVREFPESNGEWGAELVGLREHIVADERTPLLTLFAAAGLFLLIACGNVASLLIGHFDDRAHEFAIRGALGADRLTLLRQNWTQIIALCGLGGVAGVVLAYASLEVALPVLGTSLSRLDAVSIDATVLAFAVISVVVTGLLVGAGAVFATPRTSPAPVLYGNGHRIGRRRSWLRRTLVVGQVATAAVITVSVGLLVRSFLNVHAIDLGLETAGVVAADLGPLPASRYPDAASRFGFVEEVEAALSRESGVSSVAVTNRLPLLGCCANSDWERRDGEVRTERFVEMRLVSEEYFTLLGIDVGAGRTFAPADRDDSGSVGVINEELARRLWDDESPIGRSIFRGDMDVSVIGVVDDVRDYAPEREPPPTIYLSTRQVPTNAVDLLVKVEGPDAEVIQALRARVLAIDDAMPVEAWPLGQLVDEATADRRATTTLMVLLGLLATALGMIGVYGVISASVHSAVHDIGVRIALGAQRHSVLRQVLWSSLSLVMPGLVVGIVLSYSANGVIESLLYGTEPLDPAVLLLVSSIFLLVGLAAALIPARRASRVDPVRSLKSS